ncbi:BMP family ABC transporter substrate-binding protein [Halorussus salinisoli]|uniref:BMP family ABC transporter substrate-binding protein n=1 Tax=Halorussus salinisoli TaxID=2558242 RepID=UPI0010C2120F|nr:BMP family ABC transporter substrate-binding protein [Halorussus salinisoli]
MDMNSTRRDAIKAIGTVGAVGLAGCTGGNDATQDQRESVRAAWIYISEVGDLGWSWAHDQGRKKVTEEYDWLESSYSEAVNPANSQRVIKQYTQEGYDIIFGTTFEYMDPMLQIAQQNPDTLYEHCSGYKTSENMGRYFGRMYQARYLAGVAAGLVTESNQLGYVAAFPIPEVVRGINAFTLGARSVNDQVTTKVRWTNTWFDPPKEKEAAQTLIDAGVDVMAQHQDSPAAVKAANSADIWATGYDAPMGEFGGDNYLTSPIWHWEVFYQPTLEAVRNRSWESDFYWEGLQSGIVDLSEWGPSVPEDVKNTVSEKRSAIEEGNLDVWADSKFADRDGTFLFQEMGSYVEGVEGEVPN